jgi:hypothetical protein
MLIGSPVGSVAAAAVPIRLGTSNEVPAAAAAAAAILIDEAVKNSLRPMVLFSNIWIPPGFRFDCCWPGRLVFPVFDDSLSSLWANP